MLKGVTAGVVNVVRSILAFFAGRRRKDESPREAAAIAAAHAAILATDAVLSAASMAAVTIDATTIAADTAATAARIAVAAARIDAGVTALPAPPDTADAAPDAADVVEPAPADAPASADVTKAATDATPAAPVDAVVPALADAPQVATIAPVPAAATVKPAKPQGRKVMSSAFDMQAEIAKLAERIIEPVAVKLSDAERAGVVGQTRDAFEELNAGRPGPGASFENKAVSILGPVEPRLTAAERKRVVDRLSGAMAAFCQGLGQGTGQRAA